MSESRLSTGSISGFAQPLIKDLLVEQFNYITTSEIRNQNTKGLERP